MGPVCGTDQLETIEAYIEIGKAEGACIAHGGERLTDNGLDKGCFIAPTVFTNVQPQMRIAQEEIFGPVLCLMVAEDFSEALEIANGVEFGLASSIFTRDIGRAFQFLEETDVGTDAREHDDGLPRTPALIRRGEGFRARDPGIGRHRNRILHRAQGRLYQLSVIGW